LHFLLTSSNVRAVPTVCWLLNLRVGGRFAKDLQSRNGCAVHSCQPGCAITHKPDPRRQARCAKSRKSICSIPEL
jgi:hypothetical protein